MTGTLSPRPLLLVFLPFVIGLIIWISHQPRYDHAPGRYISQFDYELSYSLPRLDFSAPGAAHRDYYASNAARELCAAHGYTPFKPGAAPRSGERKIYDLFMVNTELDFLEIRLRTLYDYVDYFIIVESPRTFQGGAKNLTIRDHWHRFVKYHDKMVYHELKFPPKFKPRRTWDYEDLQRDAMFVQVFPTLSGRKAPVKGDVILVADVDEIPRPATLLILRTCEFPRRLTLSSRFYYYSFQFLHRGAEWPHPQATFYEGMAQTVRPTNLRNGDAGIPLIRDLEKGVLANAGWHCSSCFQTMEQFLNKMSSFSHAWMNHEYFQDRKRIADSVRQGVDLWGRKSEKFDRIENNLDVPTCLLENPDRFRYMLNRDGATAGFTDYP
ncbi:glycosyltransferase family 17-domain-containing protein [Thelonectria olida]|uniref:Glycosyltransferase family 17-domain-containing protein n=1 Tax=Thelonectria olida TaxID=1576542 RepID=A0A9P9AR49_9HYPO|nr:glycosyltransferase family 17-domain-containing protein [Thelonectria olida]